MSIKDIIFAVFAGFVIAAMISLALTFLLFLSVTFVKQRKTWSK